MIPPWRRVGETHPPRIPMQPPSGICRKVGATHPAREGGFSPTLHHRVNFLYFSPLGLQARRARRRFLSSS